MYKGNKRPNFTQYWKELFGEILESVLHIRANKIDL